MTNPTFAMLCTFDDSGDPFFIGIVSDEIAAVEKFRVHVHEFGDDHIEHIHMEPMRDEWAGREGRFILDLELDPAVNLFRSPKVPA